MPRDASRPLFRSPLHVGGGASILRSSCLGPATGLSRLPKRGHGDGGWGTLGTVLPSGVALQVRTQLFLEPDMQPRGLPRVTQSLYRVAGGPGRVAVATTAPRCARS